MRARGVSPVVQCSVGHIRFAVCAERSRDNNLRFLRKFHPDKIWNTLITITYLHRQFKFHLKVKHRFLAVLYSKNLPSFPFRHCVYYAKCPTEKWRASVHSFWWRICRSALLAPDTASSKQIICIIYNLHYFGLQNWEQKITCPVVFIVN